MILSAPMLGACAHCPIRIAAAHRTPSHGIHQPEGERSLLCDRESTGVADMKVLFQGADKPPVVLAPVRGAWHARVSGDGKPGALIGDEFSSPSNRSGIWASGNRRLTRDAVRSAEAGIPQGENLA